jgi:flagellar hook-basal body complex protein FliE
MIPAISGAIGPLGPSEWGVGSAASLGQDATTAVDGAGASGSGGSFSGALTGALSGLESTQAAGTTAAQQLATGKVTDPTKAITAVENASLAMDLAAQLRTKLVDSVNTVFQTQI